MAAIAFLIFMFIALSFLRSTGSMHKDKGRIGEDRVDAMLKRCFSRHDAFLRNLYLPWEDGTTTEIDEVVISESGIFVIEVKNYSGWIFGNQRDRYWTQVLPYGYSGRSIRNRFPNPILQNGYHIRSIRRVLCGIDLPVHSIVVFSDDCVFRDITYFPDGVSLIHEADLKRTIKDIRAEYRGCLDNEMADKVKRLLLKVSLDGDDVEENHIEIIRRKHGHYHSDGD